MTARARATGWLAALTMVLNGAWLLITQAGWLWVSVVDIVVLALALGVLVKRLTVLPPTGGTGERLVVDGTFGLYFGWVAVATVANIAAALVAAIVVIVAAVLFQRPAPGGAISVGGARSAAGGPGRAAGADRT